MPNIAQYLQAAAADGNEDTQILNVGTLNLLQVNNNMVQYQQRPPQRRRLIQVLENLADVNAATFTEEEAEMVPTIAYQHLLFSENQFLWSSNFKKYLKILAHFRIANATSNEVPPRTFNIVLRAAMHAMKQLPLLAENTTLSFLNLENEEVANIYQELQQEQLPINSTNVLVYFLLLHPILFHSWFASDADRREASKCSRNFYGPCPFCSNNSPLRQALAAPLKKQCYPPRSKPSTKLLFARDIRIHCQNPLANANHNAKMDPDMLQLHKFFLLFTNRLAQLDLPAAVQADHHEILPNDPEFQQEQDPLLLPPTERNIHHGAAAEAVAPQAQDPAAAGEAAAQVAANEAEVEPNAIHNMDVEQLRLGNDA